MPLVFAVLVIVVLFLNAKDSNKRYNTRASINEVNRRKTNARLEQRTLDTYMKYGYSFDEAFRRSYEDMIAAGYVPCIPRDAYGENSSACWSSTGEGPERFDSYWVRSRRDAAKEAWKQANPHANIYQAPDGEIERQVYRNFPTSEAEYLHDLKRVSQKSQALPIGTFIIYPGLGTCEVLSRNWIGDGALGGTYTLKVLTTGKIVSNVKIGDERIRLQGER